MKLVTNNGKILNKSGMFIKDVAKNKIINNLQAKIDSTKQTKYLFYNYKLENIDSFFTYINFENVTNMGNMFYQCTNLQTIPQLDTSNVTNMYAMFDGCTNLQTIPQLDTSNVANMSRMFYYCFDLQTIDITSLDKISSTNNMSSFAAYCCQLTKLIIRNMTVIPPLNTNSFEKCYHFNGTSNNDYNPSGLKDGRIYVPDNMVDSLKAATNWSAYADIIVPLSSLEE